MLGRLRARSHLVLVTLIAVLPVLGFAMILFVRAVDQTRADTIRKLDDTAGLLAEAVDIEIDALVAAADVVAALPELERGDLERLRARLQNLLPERFDGIALVGEDGRPILNTLRSLGTSQPLPALQPMLDAALASGLPIVADVGQGAAVGRRMFLIVRPVLLQGRRYGLAVGVTADRLQRLIAAAPADWIVAIADRRGVVAAHSQDARRFVGRPIAPEIDKLLAQGDAGAARLTLDGGVESYAAVRRARSSHWLAIVGEPAAAADGAVRRYIWIYGGFGAALLGFGVAAAAWLGARLSRSIEDLAEAACAVGMSGEPVVPHAPACAEIGFVLDHLQAAQCLIAARAEELIAATKEAEAANQAKSRFVAEMNHELRTPLTAIVGFSELLALENYGPLGHAKYRQYARDISHAADYLASMINDLLDYAKAEAGRFDIALEPVDVGEVAAGCVDLLRTRAEKGQVDLIAEFSSPAPIVIADARAIRQVILNLLSNAVKFTPPGGRVRLKVGGDGVDGVIEVADTGVGMNPVEIDAALQPFMQVDNEITRRQVGTGLGLPLAKRLVEEQGGCFAIESARGAGTVVQVRLPLASASAAIAGARAVPEASPVRFTSDHAARAS